MIVATAGHVDHGKTALVRALTGVETDRLEEEQRRGLTIELGYAYASRGERRWGFVDVPGHERFMATSLAGLAAARLALLAVAADEGPKPQTEAHLRCLQGLGFTRLVVALTRRDRATLAQLAATQAALAPLLSRYGFADAPQVETALPAPESFEALWLALEAGAEGSREDPVRSEAPPRVALDRAFSLPGVGPIATGLVFSGTLQAGQTLTLLPAGLPLRLASLRALDAEAERAGPGDRVALRLPDAPLARIKRGSWLAALPNHPCTRRLEMTLHWFDTPPSRRQLGVHVHHGATHTLGRLQREADLSDALRQDSGTLRTDAPLMACVGDRILLRDDRGEAVLGWGKVLDPLPPLRQRWAPGRLKTLPALAAGAWEEALGLALSASPLAFDLTPWGARLNQELEHLRAALPEALGSVSALHHRGAWETFLTALGHALDAHHQAFPAQLGLRVDELAHASGRPPRQALQEALRALIDRGGCILERNRYRRPTHAPVLSAEDEAAWGRLGHHFEANPMQPPTVNDIAKLEEIDPKAFLELCQRWHHAGRLQRVSANRYLLPEGLSALEAALRETAREAPLEGFDARAFRDTAGIGRNTAIDVLEYFDRVGLTRRRGNHRVFLGVLP